MIIFIIINVKTPLYPCVDGLEANDNDVDECNTINPIMRLILKHPKCNVHGTDDQGWTGLHWMCAKLKSAAAARLLLMNDGIDLVVHDEVGYSELYVLMNMINNSNVRTATVIFNGILKRKKN